MTFTNDELKQLKELIRKDIYGCEVLISVQRVKALIARLEAAENLIKNSECLHPNFAQNKWVLAWRKVKGEK